MVTGQKQLPYKIIKGDGVCEIYLKPISEEKLFFVWRTIYDGYQRISTDMTTIYKKLDYRYFSANWCNYNNWNFPESTDENLKVFFNAPW